MSKLFNLLKSFVLITLFTGLLFVIVEGIFSFVYVVNKMDLRFISFKVHTQYNELLGWDNIPGLTINKYVKDGHLKINSQGTRNDQDFSYEIPVGKKRWQLS